MRKTDENYEIYISRISQYLKDCSTEKLNGILGCIDPTDEKYGPTTDIVLKIMKSKKSKSPDTCSCVVF